MSTTPFIWRNSQQLSTLATIKKEASLLECVEKKILLFTSHIDNLLLIPPLESSNSYMEVDHYILSPTIQRTPHWSTFSFFYKRKKHPYSNTSFRCSSFFNIYLDLSAFLDSLPVINKKVRKKILTITHVTVLI